jgi:hypothetical protein
METLGKLFGGIGRIKLMRLFLMHPDISFSMDEIQSKTKLKKDTLRKDLAWLIATTLIKKQNRTTKTLKNTKKIVPVFILNPKCVFTQDIHAILSAKNENIPDTLKKRFSTAGTLELLIATGFFLPESESRVDLLIVGKKLKKQKIEETIAKLESEIGRELTYAFFETPEFLYRAHMYDKLIRDVVDFPHIRVLDKNVLSRIPHMA